MFIVEIAGTPDAGKTTALVTLNSILNAEGVSTSLIEETRGKNIFPQEQRGTLKYNIDVATITCNKIIKRLETIKEGIVLIDKGYVDYLFWIEYYFYLKKCTRQEADIAKKLPQFQNTLLIPNLFIGMSVSPEESMRRRGKSAMDTYNVKRIEHNIVFKDFFNSYNLSAKKWIDTSNLSKLQTVEVLKNFVCETL